ncbi:MAG: hypothetical protein II340_03615 [Succinivibrio sp.]|nr:hypothetical protein [Succinivibrio sp.]
MKDLPRESFNQSYLKKAGVNFKLNVVDTVLKKGFTLSFYLSLILLVLLLVLKFSDLGSSVGSVSGSSSTSTITSSTSVIDNSSIDNESTSILTHFLNPKQFWCMVSLLSIYLLLSFLRLLKYFFIRKRLRLDQAPIAVEAYAIVKLDLKNNDLYKRITPKKQVVLYKECGSQKPRFFTGIVLSVKTTPKVIKAQKALVFIDRKNPGLYSIDDDKFYKTVGESKLSLKMLNLKKLNPKLDGVSQKEKL